MDSLEPHKNVILALRSARTSLRIILETLAHDYNLIVRFLIIILTSNWYSQSTLQRFLRNNDTTSIAWTTPPSSPIQRPTTSCTRRRAQDRNANNVLTESPHRRRRRPIIAAAAPSAASRLPIRRLPAQRHLLASQPRDPLMNVAHSLGPMNIVYDSFHVSFLTVSCPHCNTLHWKEEGIRGSTRQNPKFSMCCGNGAVILPIPNDTPEPLRILLTETQFTSASPYTH